VFELFKNLVALVFSFTPFTQDQAIYTGIGTALVILFMVFLAGSIILLGAEFGRAAMRGDETAGPGPGMAEGGEGMPLPGQSHL